MNEKDKLFTPLRFYDNTELIELFYSLKTTIDLLEGKKRTTLTLIRVGDIKNELDKRGVIYE